MILLSRCGSAAAVRVGDGGSVEKEEKKQKMNDAISCTSLTVWRKSLLFTCDGFTVIDSTGNLIYRVDNYRGDRTDNIILMDAYGKPLFTLRRKKRRFVDKWLIFEGEAEDGKEMSSKKPMYWVRKHVNLKLQRNNHQNHQDVVVAQVFDTTPPPEKEKEKGNPIFVIQGSYERRSCQVVDGLSRTEVVAEIKRKDASIKGISFGLDVFLLIVRSGLDPAFAMSLVLLLDQMFT
ncbi:protein LURP-one-related 8-like isoform X1 [Telopea speciosissima]|uniref:protein LURP-one-related 8-like isoform X1 n=1 Tax=Telopea speciosissima TaxID=54955 RepID=UPI001CC48D81|nr:protein LURP-one-related 8-like isoform X1 [Telopea speciosissima]